VTAIQQIANPRMAIRTEPIIGDVRSAGRSALVLILATFKGLAMANEQRGGSHEQHVKAGEESHKNSPGGTTQNDDESRGSGSSRGGTHEQHVKAGEQSHKGGSTSSQESGSESSRGGSHEQHVKAGEESRKNR
jgi:hypothetical protein